MKLLLSSAQILTLEFVVHRPSDLKVDDRAFCWTCGERSDADAVAGIAAWPADTNPLICARERHCFHHFLRQDIKLDPAEFRAFVEHARGLLLADSMQSEDSFHSRLMPPCQHLPDEEEFEFALSGTQRRVTWEVNTDVCAVPGVVQCDAHCRGARQFLRKFEWTRHYRRSRQPLAL